MSGPIRNLDEVVVEGSDHCVQHVLRIDDQQVVLQHGSEKYLIFSPDAAPRPQPSR